jgi:hypothetical protein
MSGTPITINNLPLLALESADSILHWDASAGLTGRFTLAGLITVLDDSFALLSGATFTGAITATIVSASFGDNGASGGGALQALNNTNATTPAPGTLRCYRATSGSAFMYPDDTAIWRTLTATPTNANYAGGTVVGAQTSSLDTKDVLGDPLPAEDVLALIAQGAAAVRRFQYKPIVDYDNDGNPIEGPRPYGGEEFSGVVVDYAPRYGTDVDDDHPAGKSLNSINATGDLLIAVNYLAGRVLELETRLQTAVDAVEAALANFEAPPGE